MVSSHGRQLHEHKESHSVSESAGTGKWDRREFREKQGPNEWADENTSSRITLFPIIALFILLV